MKKIVGVVLFLLLFGHTTLLAQELKFEPVGSGKFIYCNNQEGLFEDTLLNGENPTYIMSNHGLTQDVYHIYISHINYTGVKQDGSQGDHGFDVELDVEFFAREDTVIHLNKAFFETTEVYAYEQDGVRHRYEEEWGLFQVCCDILGAPLYTFDGEQTYLPRKFEAVTLELKAGERVWLSEYLEGYEAVHFGKPVHIQGQFEIVSGKADVNVGAFRHNGLLKDRSAFTGEAAFGSYMRDRCHKGIANSLPEVIAKLNYEISDDMADQTALPITLYNQYAAEGSELTAWYTHLNPQNDIWSKYNVAESDILPLYYKDDAKLTFYGPLVPENEKDNVWVFDTKHSDTKGYEPALYKGDPLYYKPNFELVTMEDNLNSSCSMGNFGVADTYAVTITNSGEKARFLGLNITTASAIIAYKTDAGGKVRQGNLKNVTAEKESVIMVEEEIAPSETKTVYFSVVLPVNYNGGTKTELIVSDESQFKMETPKEKTKVQLLNGVLASETEYKDLFPGNQNSFEVLKGKDTALLRWCAWDGKPWYYYNLWQYANKAYMVDEEGHILAEHAFAAIPVASSWQNNVFYVELADGTVQCSEDGVNWEPYEGNLPEYIPFYDLSTASEWAREGLKTAFDKGICLDNKSGYRLTENITRLEFCELAGKLLEGYGFARGGGIALPKFSDTDSEAVEKMVIAGVIYGFEDGTFRPNDMLTREQAAAILKRLLRIIGTVPETESYLFSDATEISDWATESVDVMRLTGIMLGVEDNKFAPKAFYTREQAVLTVLRLLEYAEKKDLRQMP